MIQRQYCVYNKKTKRVECSIIGVKDKNNIVTYIDILIGKEVKDASKYFIKKDMYKLMFVKGGTSNDTTTRRCLI